MIITELERRIAEAKALQTKPAAKPRLTPLTSQQRAMHRLFRSIDRKHEKPKIQYFPQETRYAFPANIGNARNPLVFGKIPLEYQIRELIENARAIHAQGLANTNKQRHLTRVQSMNWKHR
jgi:hypothetical protein